MISVVVRQPISRGDRSVLPGTRVQVSVEEARGWGVTRPDGEVEFATAEDRAAYFRENQTALIRALMPTRPLSGGAVSLRATTARRRVRVGWYHDTEAMVGGAEHSNAEVIRIGRLLGFDVDFIHPGNFDAVPHDPDVRILNNLEAYGDEQRAQLTAIVLESGAPWVWYEHDFQFCFERNALPCAGTGDGCGTRCSGDEGALRRARYGALIRGAALRVFISPMQLAVHSDRLPGIAGLRTFVMTPPVNTERFRPVEGVEREPDLAVCTAGKLPTWKGRDNMAAWAAAHPDCRVEVYVAGGAEGPLARRDGLAPAFRALSNVRVLDTLPLADLPALYSRARYLLHLPARPEPAGRTPVEAALCGCEPIVNEHVGCAGFGLLPLWQDDPESLRYTIELGPVNFWRAVEGVLC